MNKINEILVGSNNKGKFKEIADLLPKKIKKISPSQLNIGSPEESGKTFSRKKWKNRISEEKSGKINQKVEKFSRFPKILRKKWKNHI